MSQALILLAEACATSEATSKQLLDAKVANALAPLLPPLADKRTASLAIRLLSALAMHNALTETIIRSSALAPLLARLGSEIGDVGVQCAMLLINLADGPRTRMRLLHAGAIEVVT